MKSLPKTIDRILKLDPNLESSLVPIKNGVKRNPQKSLQYWKQLLSILNSQEMAGHPKRNEIKGILTFKRKTPGTIYTFETVAPDDTIIGVIPENMADRIRRYDRLTIKMAKIQTEASMTRNMPVLVDLQRKQCLIEIELKKLWVALKDHFDLWSQNCPYCIKNRGGVLVLTVKNPGQQQGGGGNNGGSPVGFIGDPRMLREIFRRMGLEPPEEE